ncbi:MAG: hypothetical protein NZ853_04130 [Leptospiraceae bacterium]|nr:hypothetical protein [Leptospiraceae bacterium]MDW7975362.1 nitrilase-related carbon-nitrogen hydrolase [Leptospiraceae bacterium]
MKKNLLLVGLSILFGIIGTLSLEPFRVPVLRWMVPWVLFYVGDVLKHQSIKKILLYSFLIALSGCVFAFHWIIHLFVEYGGIPLYASLLLFIPYSFLLNTKIPLILLFLSKLKPKFRIFSKYTLLGIPLIITLLDIFTPQVFNWYWGNLVTQNLYFSQIADIVGIHGITFFYILFSYVFYRLFKIFIKNYKLLLKVKLIKIYAVFLFLFVLIHVYGFFQINYYDNLSQNVPKIRVALIQPNAPLEKYGENKVTENVLIELMSKTIPRLVEEAILKSEGKLDLVVLPESAIPYYTTQKEFITLRLNVYHPNFEYLIHSINGKYNVDVFFNELGYGLKGNRIQVYNSSALFSRLGKKDAIYHKRRLIAFGEQIPYAEFLDSTGLIQFVPESVRYSRFQPGTDFTLIPYSLQNYQNPINEQKEFPFQVVDEILSEEKIKKYFENRKWEVFGYFMPLICYEVIQPDYVLEFFRNSRSSIDFIVNITQDKWYGKTIQSYQHLELARIRSIEFRKSLVRSTNSGVSTSVDPIGRYIHPIYGNLLTSQETEEVQVVDIPIIRDVSTIYTKIGIGWLWFLGFLYIFLLVLMKLK